MCSRAVCTDTHTQDICELTTFLALNASCHNDCTNVIFSGMSDRRKQTNQYIVMTITRIWCHKCTEVTYFLGVCMILNAFQYSSPTIICFCFLNKQYRRRWTLRARHRRRLLSYGESVHRFHATNMRRCGLFTQSRCLAFGFKTRECAVLNENR